MTINNIKALIASDESRSLKLKAIYTTNYPIFI